MLLNAPRVSVTVGRWRGTSLKHAYANLHTSLLPHTHAHTRRYVLLRTK